MSTMPYLTAEMPGIGGRIKERPDDFRVEELPLYEPCGEGTHVYFRVVKAGITTLAAVERIARHMGVRPSEIGVAGLKDARAVTSQMMSLEHADGERLREYRDGQIHVAGVFRHGNKLRTGHLAGNRFVIRIRGVEATQLDAASQVLDVLLRRGVPNYFGQQRFGARGDTDRLGEALVRGELDGFVAIYLGQSRDDNPPECKAARDAFDAGCYVQAQQLWPRHFANERRALAAYKRAKKPRLALTAIDKRMRRLYVSSLQSAIFNEVLARRVGSLDRLFVGDLAEKTDSGGVFAVEDAAAEQPRADRFEISPTGPIVGHRAMLADGDPGQIERQAIAARDIDQEDFRRVGSMKVKGARRALRFRIDGHRLSVDHDEHGEYLELTFTTPRGCYATVALREIMKADQVPSGPDAAG